jgi:hypothetical protein
MLDAWKSGKEPEKGPQLKRQFSCGPQGRTSLQLPLETKIHDRDFGAAKAEWEEARAKAAAAKKK